VPRNLSRDREPDIPSNTFTWFFTEAFRRLWVSKRTSFVAIVMIAISLLILGFFLLVAENLDRSTQRWKGRSRITVYFATTATAEQMAAVEQALAAKPAMQQRHAVSRETAQARFKEQFPNLADVVGQLGENPFPASIEIDVDPKLARMPQFSREVDQLAKLPGVDEIARDWQWVARVERIVEIVSIIGLVAGGILAIAAAFTIANVIRLTMMLYREEIEIMRLVGATERMIRGPFIIEGVLQGAIGGLLALALLFGVYAGAKQSLHGATSLVWSFLFAKFLPWQTLAALVAGGIFAGWFGSWLSVRERVQEEA
jgi:cell division transport system permease protein